MLINGNMFLEDIFQLSFTNPMQMTKLAIIPCTVLLETLFLSKRFRLGFIHNLLFQAEKLDIQLQTVFLHFKTRW